MAGLYGLKILLLLAGLIELAICQKAQSSAATPATSVSLTPKPTSTATTPSDRANSDLSTNTSASETDNQTQTSDPASTSLSMHSNHSTIQTKSWSTSTPPTQNQTSPASTPTLNTSFTTAATPATSVSLTPKPTSTATTPSDRGNFNTTTPKCSYKVNATKYGFRISISNLPPTTVTISYKEQNDEKIQNMTFNHSQNSSIHNVMSLKPCTNYTVTIREHDCDIQGSNNLTTLEIEQDDITANTKIMPGEICYSSLWDISEAIKDPKFTKDTSRNLCFKLKPNDYCSNVSTTFEQKTCDNPNSTFTKITSIPVEPFMDVQKVDLTHTQVLPAILKWTNMPVNCLSNLTFNYTCRGDNQNEFFSAMVTDKDTVLNDMEPFTAYTCTSHIYGSNKSFENTTPLKIDCDLAVTELQNISWSNESISLNWSTEVKNCPGLSNITYECHCTNETDWISEKYNTEKKQCNIHNLEAFTYYNCFVKPVKYKDKPINNNAKQITVKTAIGVPAQVEPPKINFLKNNAITITCGKLDSKFWKGSELTYHARITPPHHEPEENKKSCSFTFKDLSYLTNYTVEVFAKNENYKSDPRVDSITTKYNDKALFGLLIFLIFLITLTSLALYCHFPTIRTILAQACTNSHQPALESLESETWCQVSFTEKKF